MENPDKVYIGSPYTVFKKRYFTGVLKPQACKTNQAHRAMISGLQGSTPVKKFGGR